MWVEELDPERVGSRVLDWEDEMLEPSKIATLCALASISGAVPGVTVDDGGRPRIDGQAPSVKAAWQSQTQLANVGCENMSECQRHTTRAGGIVEVVRGNGARLCATSPIDKDLTLNHRPVRVVPCPTK